MWVTHKAVVAAPNSHRSHKRRSICQDATGVWRRDGTVMLAVADGNSNSERGAEAAELAIAHTTRHLIRSPFAASEVRADPRAQLYRFTCVMERVRQDFLNDLQDEHDSDQW